MLLTNNNIRNHILIPTTNTATRCIHELGQPDLEIDFANSAAKTVKQNAKGGDRRERHKKKKKQKKKTYTYTAC